MMKNNYISNLEPAMKILERYFHYTERTTLNRMRKNEKSDKNSFKILISCLLSLRAKDETTNRISKELFKVADTPEKLAKINTKKLEKIIFSTGHYHKKAQTLKHVSKELIKKFNSKVPDNKEDLMSIKGVGPKTSNLVLNFAFNQPYIPVDVHCHRIPNRLGWVLTKTPEQTEKELEKILPKDYWMEFNGIFVLFGKTICVPVSPKCSICPIRDYCPRIGVIQSR